MKTLCTLLIGLPLAASAQLLTTPDRLGQSAEPGEWVVTSREPHARTWSRVTRATLPTGETIVRTNRAFVEVGTGICFRDPGGAYRDSAERVSPAPGGAVADQGQCVAFFPKDLADGAIQIQMPNGKQIAAAPRLLAYADAGGRNILIGEIKACQGRIVPPNTVVYEDVCPEDIKGVTVRFSYHFWGVEADVLFTGELPPRPEAFGLSGERGQCALEMWTEWFAEDPLHVAAAAGPSAVKWAGDDDIDFGAAMRLGEGKAFALPRAGGAELPVGKEMATLEGGRRFLIERVSSADFFDLAALPSKEGASIKAPVDRNRFLATTVKGLPVRPRPRPSGPAMEVAAGQPPETGLALDWTLVQSGGAYTFHSGTYYVRSLVLLGQATIEGGSVLKFTNNASLHVGTNLVLRTSQFLAAILTSCRDGTVGESIPGGSGEPVRLNATYLYNSQTSACDYKHLRFRYAGTAIHSFAAPAATVWHSQFIDCATCVQSSYLSGVANIGFNNVLMDRCDKDAFTSASMVVSGAHVTANEMNTLHGVASYSGRDYYYTNSLARCVTNWTGTDPRELGSGYADFAVVDAGADNPWVQLGAGCFYLPAGSAYRDAGKTNVTSALVSDLKETTTWGPVVLGPSVSSNDLVLSPQVERDVALIDIGYHYPVLDYLVCGRYVTNASVTIQPGTVIGVYSTNGSGYGLGVSGGVLSSQGTPSSPCRVVQYNLAQESGMTNWARPANGLLGTWWSNGRLNLRFTHFSVPAADSTHVFLYDGLPAVVQDCRFSGGYFDSENPAVTLRNNLFEGVGTVLFAGDTNQTTLRNNLFKGGTLDYLVLQTNSVVKDNAFDQTMIYDYSAEYGTYDGGYNAFINTTGRLMPTNVNDLVLTSFTYTNGPMGNYYQVSTNLVDRGSRGADLSGLYHQTTRLSQVKETNSVVDIGIHFVAVDANGNPVDSDGDLVSDWGEDIDGDGVVDSGETDWQSASDPGLRVWITRPRDNASLP